MIIPIEKMSLYSCDNDDEQDEYILENYHRLDLKDLDKLKRGFPIFDGGNGEVIFPYEEQVIFFSDEGIDSIELLKLQASNYEMLSNEKIAFYASRVKSLIHDNETKYFLGVIPTLDVVSAKECLAVFYMKYVPKFDQCYPNIDIIYANDKVNRVENTKGYDNNPVTREEFCDILTNECPLIIADKKVFRPTSDGYEEFQDSWAGSINDIIKYHNNVEKHRYTQQNTIVFESLLQQQEMYSVAISRMQQKFVSLNKKKVSDQKPEKVEVKQNVKEAAVASLIGAGVIDNETDMQNIQKGEKMATSTELKTTKKGTLDIVKGSLLHGAAVGVADEAGNAILDITSDLLFDVIPTEALATSQGKMLAKLFGATLLVQLTQSGLLEDEDGKIQKVSEFVLEAVGRDFLQPKLAALTPKFNLLKKAALLDKSSK